MSNNEIKMKVMFSDRYMPLCGLCNLATYLIPREYIPVLSCDILRKLSGMGNEIELT